MNKWKVAFFTLLAIVVLTIGGLMYLAVADVEQAAKSASAQTEGNVVVVETTAKEFEAIAMQYLGDALGQSPVPVDIAVEDQIYLYSTLTVFGVNVPITMGFEPLVEDGNITLEQTAMNVGRLNIPPKTILKIMRDSVDFPDWVTVLPNDEQIYVDISRINIADGSRVRAKEIDLPNDRIVLEIVIPTKE